MRIAEAAEIVLKESRRPLHVRELVQIIEQRGLFKFGAKNPESVVAHTLGKDPSRFVKIGASTFRIAG
jgi:HB1, ASXL, restriction endonuclease HTH domain